MRRIWVAAVLLVATGLPALAQERFSWSGAYIGAHAGYAWGEAKTLDDINDGVAPGPFKWDLGGGFGGGTIGYNAQFGAFVLGVEGDLGYMNPGGEGRIPSSVPPNYQALTIDGGLYGDLTLRAGVAMGPVLLYGKGGWAMFAGEAKQTTTKPGFVTHGTDSFNGWVAGGGVEYMLTPQWTIKAEYLHFDFGKQGGDQTSISDDPIGHVYHNWTDFNVDTFKVGVGYKF